MKLTIKNFVLLSVWVSPKNLSGVSGVRERGQACNVTKSDTPAWAFFTFFKLYKWYQNGRSVSRTGETLQEWREAKRSRFQRVEDSALISSSKNSFACSKFSQYQNQYLAFNLNDGYHSHLISSFWPGSDSWYEWIFLVYIDLSQRNKKHLRQKMTVCSKTLFIRIWMTYCKFNAFLWKFCLYTVRIKCYTVKKKSSLLFLKLISGDFSNFIFHIESNHHT